MNTRIKDISGQKFGRLLVEGFVGIGKYSHAKWNCVCDCGNSCIIRSGSLIGGMTKSCGCLSKEIHTKHGATSTPEYRVWCHIKNRCSNSNTKDYKDYGGRGIEVCERWLSFENFFEDMGLKPSPCHSIDRVDNEKGYYKENCKWSTMKEQCGNRRSNRWITFNGKTQIVTDWAKELHINEKTLYSRLGAGWSIEESLQIK